MAAKAHPDVAQLHYPIRVGVTGDPRRVDGADGRADKEVGADVGLEEGS